MPVDDLYALCAPGTKVTDEMTDVGNGATLRLIQFLSDKEKSMKNPAVVFVAGWITRIESWKDVLLEMTREFNVYYIETREKISSNLSGKTRFDVSSIGDDIVRIIGMLGLKKDSYVLFGSSLGATVILDCCRYIRERPSALVLIAPNAEFRMPLVWKIIITFFYPPFYFMLKPAIKWYLKHFRLNVNKDLAQYTKYCKALDSADPFKLKPAARAFSKYQIWGILREVMIPVLIIGGSHDKLHEPENLKRMVRELPDARYLDLETNARTHSGEVVKHLKQFIRSV
ncbi:alpha/beta hydrolase [bacterium]|nr:alpha/beta hydrolase [bacterium]